MQFLCGHISYKNYFYRPYRTFHDQYSQHSHDALISNPRFKKMVEATGLELDGCEGGYESRLKDEYGDVELTGEIEMRVRFKADGKIRVYCLDLDGMKLLPDYHEYEPNRR